MDVFRLMDSRMKAGRFPNNSTSFMSAPRLLSGALVFVLMVPISLRAEDKRAKPPSSLARSAMKVNLQPVTDSESPQINLTMGRGTLIDASEQLKRASVANPDVADVAVLSPHQVLLTGKMPGTTELVLWDSADKQATFSVVVEMDVADIKEAIKRVVPGANIDVRPVRSSLVLSGVVPSVDAADRAMEIARILTPSVTNHLRIAGESQVLLRCTVAEVDKTSTRQLGINGWLAGDNVHDMFAVNQIDGINPVNIGAARAQNILTPNGMVFATDKDLGLPLRATPSLSLGFPRLQMQLFLQAMRDNGLLKILAEPNLVALNGQEARFLAGGEIPYPVVSATGTPGVQFREFGIQLRFLPTIIGQQKIRLTVSPTVSEPDFSIAVNNVPGLRSRGATTTVELASGSTIAIAGLLSEQSRGSAKKIPALGDVPVLGALFSSVSYAKNTTELVILITPELVTSMNPDQVTSVPGQFLTAPNDFELMGLGLLEGKPQPDLAGPDAALRSEVDPRLRKFAGPPEQMSLHGPWGHAEASETQTQ